VESADDGEAAAAADAAGLLLPEVAFLEASFSVRHLDRNPPRIWGLELTGNREDRHVRGFTAFEI
jgi:hypothetical protein